MTELNDYNVHYPAFKCLILIMLSYTYCLVDMTENMSLTLLECVRTLPNSKTLTTAPQRYQRVYFQVKLWCCEDNSTSWYPRSPSKLLLESVFCSLLKLMP